MDLRDFRGVVFDLDGTVVRLDVPWEEAEDTLRKELRDLGVRTDGRSVWTLLDVARERDLLADIEPSLNAFEIDGAARSDALAMSEVLPTLDVPVAICSLNCEAACRRALAQHGLDPAVDVVVGRDTIRPWKPDPAPLIGAIDRLDRSRDDVCFVGDSPRDANTAKAAGVRYLDVEDVIARSQPHSEER